MKEISKNEVDSLCGTGVGYSCFMGGISPDKNMGRIEALGDKFYYLEPNEETPLFIREGQAKEAEEYIQSMI